MKTKPTPFLRAKDITFDYVQLVRHRDQDCLANGYKKCLMDASRIMSKASPLDILIMAPYMRQLQEIYAEMINNQGEF